jgi:hypothetical protein
MLFRILLGRYLLSNPHKLLKPVEQRSASLRAHSDEYRPDACNELLVRFQKSGATSLGKEDKDLAAVVLIAAAFHQAAFFEAIYRAHNRRGIDSYLPGNRTDSAGFSLLPLLDQSQYHKLCRAESLLVSMFEPCSQHLAQV